MKVFKNIKEITKRTGFITVAFFIVIVILYIEFNSIIEKTTTSQIDCTTDKAYSITQESKSRLSAIESDVTIKLINFSKYTVSTDVTYSVSLIKKYPEINSHIKVEESEDDTYTEAVITISCGENIKTIYTSALQYEEFDTDTSAAKTYDITEQTITNAITSVVNNNTKNVYFYLNHSAYLNYFTTVYNTLITTMQNDGYEAYYINLDKQTEIPEDCSCLVIPALKEDISESERDIIVAYINKGGKILVMQEAGALVGSELPIYQQILDMYGVSISNGVVEEQDENCRLDSNPGRILAKICNNDFIEKTNDNNTMFMVDPGCVQLKSDDELNNLGVTYNVIASASSSAYLRTDTSSTETNRIDSDEDAPNAILALEASKSIDENTKSDIIVFSGSLFALDLVSQSSDGSVSSMVTIGDVLTGSKYSVDPIYVNKNKETLEIALKKLTNSDMLLQSKSYDDSVEAVSFIKSSNMAMSLFGFPFAIIIVGYFVWRYRKLKK